MRINLQRFTLSTLTFSLATTLAVAGFSESANAQRKGKRIDKSNVQPALTFEALFETDNGKPIVDEDGNPNNNSGIFLNAIKVDRIQIDKNDKQLQPGAEIFDGGKVVERIAYTPFNNEAFTFNLSAKRQDDLIQYQIYQGDINSPDIGIRFAPIEAPSSGSNLDFINNIENIIESSNNGEYTIEETNDKFTQNGAGVLGLAINKSIRFLDEDDNDINDRLDDLKITQIGSRPSTSIPEPTTTLASIFALGFAGKFLRKTKKNNV